MSISGMTLGLPKGTDSDAGEIRTGVEELYSVRDTMLGYSEDSDASLQSAANEFIGSLTWDISSASQKDLDSWQNVAELLTSAGLALGFFADAVDEYEEARSELESRWEQHKTDALARVEDDDGDLNFNGMTQKDSEIQHLISIRVGLLSEHGTARETFDEATDEAENTFEDEETLDYLGNVLTGGRP